MVTFIDFETRSLCDISRGVDNYASDPSTEVLCCAWAVDDGPVQIWSPEHFWSRPEHAGFVDRPPYVAWNSRFDRLIYHHCVGPTKVEDWVDAAALAEANVLPGKLAKACEALGTSFQKDPRGKELIELLSKGEWDPEYRDSEEMTHMREYCMRDVESMREAWSKMLPVVDWKDFWVSERINDRGVQVDLPFVRAAHALADRRSDEVDAGLEEFEQGLTKHHHARKLRILKELLDPVEELREVTSTDKGTREFLRKMLDDSRVRDLFKPAKLAKLERFLDLLEGTDTAYNKFDSILRVAHEGRVKGAYIFNGAGQTGRWSSRGVQLHNLKREVPKDFEAVRDEVMNEL